MEKDSDWKASESSAVDTKQKDGIGVHNQTTNSSKPRVPLVTIIVIAVLLIIVSFFLLL
ncbi:hypothetical protein LCGC14_1811580 [marine sediment metagenome]|uniref:Uncharacterized protein n=1 Tax=marine sediment metagenome TaxID=412755 RepID=A0A0F9JL93_9ZZZZ